MKNMVKRGILRNNIYQPYINVQQLQNALINEYVAHRMASVLPSQTKEPCWVPLWRVFGIKNSPIDIIQQRDLLTINGKVALVVDAKYVLDVVCWLGGNMLTTAEIPSTGILRINTTVGIFQMKIVDNDDIVSSHLDIHQRRNTIDTASPNSRINLSYEVAFADKLDNYTDIKKFLEIEENSILQFLQKNQHAYIHDTTTTCITTYMYNNILNSMRKHLPRLLKEMYVDETCEIFLNLTKLYTHGVFTDALKNTIDEWIWYCHSPLAERKALAVQNILQSYANKSTTDAAISINIFSVLMEISFAFYGSVFKLISCASAINQVSQKTELAIAGTL